MADITLREFDPSDTHEHMRAELADGMIAGVTGVMNGEVVGYAGFREVYGRHFAFFHLEDERARMPFLIHRAVKASIAIAEAGGISPIFTFCDETHPRARAWMLRLGFRELRADERDPVIEATEATTGHRVWIKEIAV